MNMIRSEQEAAWQMLPCLHHQVSECLTSGIRKEERDNYLNLTKQWNWILKAEKQEMDWLGFHFTIKI